METILVSGVSGAGKSVAVRALEDIGFYCVDNLPPALMRQFIDLIEQANPQDGRAAIVIDARTREVLEGLSEVWRDLQSRPGTHRILFLEADDKVIIRRYKETRRKHPLMSGEIQSVEEALALERKFLRNIREKADYLIDTSLLSSSQLKARISDLFLRDHEDSMSITCISFGYKYGIPADADLVFDVRCLPNPYYVEELKEKTGKDPAVQEYVMGAKESQEVLENFIRSMDLLVPLYRKEGKSQLTIAIGCTGGQHRSVVFAQRLADALKTKNHQVSVSHRDCDR